VKTSFPTQDLYTANDKKENEYVNITEQAALSENKPADSREQTADSG
jgi:hypothetical protein